MGRNLSLEAGLPGPSRRHSGSPQCPWSSKNNARAESSGMGIPEGIWRILRLLSPGRGSFSDALLQNATDHLEAGSGHGSLERIWGSKIRCAPVSHLFLRLHIVSPWHMKEHERQSNSCCVHLPRPAHPDIWCMNQNMARCGNDVPIGRACAKTREESPETPKISV
jgi:hypothetical protein